jgi:phosphoribosylamine---glycine ligase
MRVLGVGHHVALADMYLRLLARGCELRVFAEDGEDILPGDIPRSVDWRAELTWVGRDGIVVFEDVGLSSEQAALSAESLRQSEGVNGGEPVLGVS